MQETKAMPCLWLHSEAGRIHSLLPGIRKCPNFGSLLLAANLVSRQFMVPMLLRDMLWSEEMLAFLFQGLSKGSSSFKTFLASKHTIALWFWELRFL